MSPSVQEKYLLSIICTNLSLRSLLLVKFQISQKRPYMFKHIQSVRILLEDKCQLGACHRVTRAPQAMAITHWAPCADTTIGFAHSHHNCLAHSSYSCLAHSHHTAFT